MPRCLRETESRFANRNGGPACRYESPFPTIYLPAPKFSLGLVGYVTTLFRLSAVFTLIWGGWLLGEPGLRQRLPASMLMVDGAVVIVLST